MTAGQEQPGRDRCGARHHHGTGTCQLPAGWGTDHPGVGTCRKHLGNTAQHIAAATEEQARQACLKFAIPVKTTASDALRDELWRCNGAVHWFNEQIAELTAETLVWNTSERRVKTSPGQGAQAGVPQVEVVQSAKVHPLYKLYCDERDRLVSVAAEIERLGLDARMVRVSEQQGAQLARVVQAILSDLHLTAEQQARVPEVVPRRLRAIDA
jgi:hypothetical protein